MRGEYAPVAADIPNAAGLSPRARGILRGPPKSLRIQRSIPACAGNTAIANRDTSSNEVYPRVRGEYERLVKRFPMPQGLSPRARGIRTLKWR